MSRTLRLCPTRVATVTCAAFGVIALAGCGAGQITQTNTQVPAVIGANGGVGSVAVRDAHIEFSETPQGANIYPRGAAAPLSMHIVNSGGEPDRLVSASSPVAASVQISGDAEIAPGRVLLIEGEPAAAPSAAAPTSGAAPTATAAPTVSAAPSATSAAAAPTTAPGEENLPAGATSGQVVLSGLKEDVRAGLTYPLVLNFEKAGQVTLKVPVGFPSEPREETSEE